MILTMEKEWEAFRQKVYPHVTEPAMIEEIKSVFFSGGLAFFNAMNSFQNLSDERQVRQLDTLLAEVNTQIASHIKRRLANG